MDRQDGQDGRGGCAAGDSEPRNTRKRVFLAADAAGGIVCRGDAEAGFFHHQDTKERDLTWMDRMYRM